IGVRMGRCRVGHGERSSRRLLQGDRGDTAAVARHEGKHQRTCRPRRRPQPIQSCEDLGPSALVILFGPRTEAVIIPSDSPRPPENPSVARPKQKQQAEPRSKKHGRPSKGADGSAAGSSSAGQEQSETVAGYFRKVFAENPKLLKERSNEE